MKSIARFVKEMFCCFLAVVMVLTTSVSNTFAIEENTNSIVENVEMNEGIVFEETETEEMVDENETSEEITSDLAEEDEQEESETDNPEEETDDGLSDESDVLDESSEESDVTKIEQQTAEESIEEIEEETDEIIFDNPDEINNFFEIEDDTTLIYTAEELASISMDGNYELANDIDLSEYNEGAWTSLGSSSCPFTGTFDGNNHAIINIPENGVWQEIKGATIHNLVLKAEPEKVISSNGLLCYKETDSNISQCFAEGKINGGSYVGLLIGYASGGIISQCQVQGNVSGNGYFNGLKAYAYIGGLVGRGYDTGISDCMVLADVSCSMWYGYCSVSGICSGSSTYVNNSIFIGTLNGLDRYDIGSKAYNCYFVEENNLSQYYPLNRLGKAVLISDLRDSSTLLRFDFESIWKCQSERNAGICSLKWLDDVSYSDGNYVSLRVQYCSESDKMFLSNRFDSYVYFDRNIVVKNDDVAYILEKNSQKIYDCKIDDINGNYLHVLAENLQPGEYFLFFKKDSIFDEIGISSSEDIKGFSFTISDCCLQGTGTEDDPYQITNVNQLNNVYYQPDKSYILMNDIDAATTEALQTVGLRRNGMPAFWYDYEDNSIGGIASPFSGVFDGNGHIIRNVKSFSGSKSGTGGRRYSFGLFAKMDNAVVKNLNIELADDFGINSEKSDYFYFGIISSEGTGVIHNCSVSGNISVDGEKCDRFGWIAGKFDGTIEECATIGKVTFSHDISGYYAGGIVGELCETGEIQNCYSYVENAYGGLVGDNKGSIDLSYYSGLSSIVYKNSGNIGNNVYYDSEKRAVSGFGTPLTATEMINPESYINFDFEKIWACEPFEAPYLQGLGHYILPGIKRPYEITISDDSLFPSYMSFYTKPIINGLTYGDLFTKYPEYLENNPYSSIEARLISAAIEAEDSNSDSQSVFASWIYSLKKGVNFFVDEFASNIGLKKNDYEQFKYDLVYELIQKQMVQTDKFGYAKQMDSSLNSIIDKIGFADSIGYEIENDTLANELFSSFRPIFGDISTARKFATKYTDENFKEANTLNKYFDTSEKIISMITLLSIYQIESESIDNLIEIQKKAGNSELVITLESISAERKKDPVSYIGEHYLKESVLGKMKSIIPSILTAGTGAMAVSLGTRLMGDILPKIYESNNASVESIVKTLIMHQYWQSSDRVCSKYVCDFIKGNVSEKGIMEYETAYNFRLECMKLWFEEAQGCTSDPVLTGRLSYSEMIGNEITYEHYLNCCLLAVDADIKSGKIVVKDDEIIRKDKKGVVIDENYNKVEVIQEKLSDIENKYKPNNDIHWEDNWEGQTGNMGFTRMVFDYIFGCDLSNAVSLDKQYELLENGHVELVGQLSEETINETGILSLFEKAQIGDIVQGYNQEEGSFSAIVNAVGENSVSLLECSDDDNAIICNDWNCSDLLSRFGEELENCGISLYRVSTYVLLPNEKENSESDDDFVIEDSVLKSYIGNGKIVIIPDGVTEIEKNCFSNNVNIVSVSLPESLLVIGDYAFNGCINLSGNLALPQQLQQIGKGAFCNCTGLVGDLIIPTNVVKIGSQAFAGCSGLCGQLVINSENLIFEIDSLPSTGNFSDITNYSKGTIILDEVEGCQWISGDTSDILEGSMESGSAKLVRSKVSIHFDVNGACDGFDDIHISLGEKIGELPEPNIPNHLFLGWYTHKIGGVKISKDFIPKENSIVVYAHWQEDVGDIIGEDFEEYCRNGMPTEYWVAGLNDCGYEYTGSTICPQINVYFGKNLLVENKDYSVKYKDNKNVGTAKVVVTGKGNYCNTTSWEFSIVPKSLNNGIQLSDGFEITVSDKKYTGKLNISKPQVKYHNNTLKEGKDYTLSYGDNQIDIGNVNFSISGINNFSGSYSSSYRIYEKALDFSKIYVETIPAQTYSGEKIEIPSDEIVVYSDKSKKSLLSSEDYTVSYVNNQNVGTATMIISGIGNYSNYGNSKRISFKIVSKKMDTPIVNFTDEEEIIYTGKKVTPKVIVRDSDTWKIIDSSNYSLKYVNNIIVADKATNKHPYVEIKMKKNYSGKSNIPFSISPKAIEEGQADITINNVADKGTPIDVNKLVVKVVYNRKVLKRNVDYVVSYEEDENSIQTVYIEYIGNYSGNDRKDFKKYKDICTLTSSSIVIDSGETKYTYSGEKICPSISIRENNTEVGYEYQLIVGKDYTISYNNNVNVNNVGSKKPTWKVIGKGAYKGTIEGYFDILPLKIDEENYSIDICDVKYSKKELKPSVTIKNIQTGKILKKKKDFTVEYMDNLMPEKSGNIPKVYITGIGNYSTSESSGGKIVRSFRIYEKDISRVYVEPICSYTYSGEQHKPQNIIVYSDKSKVKLLSEGTDYLIEYGKNINVGYGTVYIIGIGEYGGKKEVRFIIKPKWL